MISNDIAIQGKASRYKGDRWAAFDALPSDVRRALHEGQDWCPLWIAAEYRKAFKVMSYADATRAAVRLVRLADALERADFAAAYAKKYGPLPAQAARSTIVRYDEVERQRARRGAKRVPA